MFKNMFRLLFLVHKVRVPAIIYYYPVSYPHHGAHTLWYNSMFGRSNPPLLHSSQRTLYLILGFFPAQIKFINSFFQCMKWLLFLIIGIVWNKYKSLGRVFILIVAILPRRDKFSLFYLIKSFWMSFHNFS